MSDSTNQPQIHSATITDRGLNERRPLNEDSLLADDERRIFAVADGVGGAEAGEVASKTSIEVIDEAFRHQLDDADIEDLMEVAIQRANASIYQMSREHSKLSNMATTIVALHVDENVATIAHVGDSRMYRVTPDGSILRETEDHSMVEEEVRAGRMTVEQAANHPSKNVISRALGAEETVEVDLKTIQIEDGTCFLLCSDGITRHIADHEIRQVLLASDDLAAVCEELKRRCFERGAEDNLTAIVVRVGEVSDAALEARFGARTLSIEYPPAAEATMNIETPFVGNLDLTEDALNLAPSVIAPAKERSAIPEPATQNRPINIPENRRSSGGGSVAARFVVFLLFLAGVAAAFYVGTNYRGPLPFGLTRVPEVAPPRQATPVAEDPLLTFERGRRTVDRAPSEWLSAELPKELARQTIAKPLDSTQPQFLYLYGRASLLAGNKEEAGKAFQQAITTAEKSPTAENDTIRKDSLLALTALTTQSDNDRQRALEALTPKAAQPAK